MAESSGGAPPGSEWKRKNHRGMAESSGGAPPGSDHSTPLKFIFGKYELGRFLGRGSSARVYQARHLASGHTVAVKVFPKPRRASGPSSSTICDAFIREISALRCLRHPHIIRLREVLASRSKVYLVLELARGGELLSSIRDSGRLSEDVCRRLFRQLISAVAYAHSCGVFHRDLKPDNLLLDDASDLKISDFGLSALRSSSSDLLHTQCGTLAYMAPEILQSKKGTAGYDGAKADLWSCGVILFVLNAGYLPFNDYNLACLYRKIYSGYHQCPRWTPPDLRHLIARLLDPNPATRITVDEILRDPWFAKGCDSDHLSALMRLPGDKHHYWGLPGGELNAFGLVSFASGLDLSGLFMEAATHRDWFVSADPAGRILDRVEEVAMEEGMVVRREGEKRLGAVVQSRDGDSMVRLEVCHLAGGGAVVEVNGGAVERGFWREKLRSVL